MRHRRVAPLIIEWTVHRWEPGSDLIGDITELGTSPDIIVSEKVRRLLEPREPSVGFRAFGMHQDPKLKRPKRVTARTKRRVWLPYEGPPLWELVVESSCGTDLARSGWAEPTHCSTCGRKDYKRTDSTKHDVFPANNWDGSMAFRHADYLGNPIVVTEDFVSLMKSEGVTNLSVRRIGAIEP